MLSTDFSRVCKFPHIVHSYYNGVTLFISHVSIFSMVDNSQLWNSVLSEVESQISRANFSTWFRNTHIVKQDEGTIFVAVPNEFVKEWLSQKFHTMILKSLRELSDGVRGLEYVIAKTPKEGEEKKNQNQEVGGLPLADVYVDKESNLNPRYTFDSFIVGSFNNLAYAASQAIIKNPGMTYNPFFVYGGTGVGKTHLIQSVGNHLKKDLGKKVLYITSEKFLVDYISSLQNDTTNIFKEKYRGYDTLIMDDIQFLSNKEKTQEELFHVFNSLYDSNKQIIFSSDVHPNFIPGLESRLKSRFSAGMIVDINQPEYEARSSIITLKLKSKGILVQQDVIDYLALSIEGNVRELEGAINTLTCHYSVGDRGLTLEEVKRIIKHTEKPKKNIAVKDVVKIIAGFYDIPEKDIYEKTRRKEVVRPRQVVMYLLREDFNASYPMIGKNLGGRDHTTVMHSCEKMKKDVMEDDVLRSEVEKIRSLM
jgi:chromosomal replication initiator protein